jgi:hypothetical protein
MAMWLERRDAAHSAAGTAAFPASSLTTRMALWLERRDAAHSAAGTAAFPASSLTTRNAGVLAG